MGQLPARAETLKLVRERFGAWKQKPGSGRARQEFSGEQAPARAGGPARFGAGRHSHRPARRDAHGSGLLSAARRQRYSGRWRQLAPVSSTCARRRDSLTTRTANWIAAKTLASSLPSRRCAMRWSSRPWKPCSATLSEMAKAPVSAGGVERHQELHQRRVPDRASRRRHRSPIRWTWSRPWVCPNDYLEMFTTRVRSVEPDQIQAAAQKYLDAGESRHRSGRRRFQDREAAGEVRHGTSREGEVMKLISSRERYRCRLFWVTEDACQGSERIRDPALDRAPCRLGRDDGGR